MGRQSRGKLHPCWDLWGPSLVSVPSGCLVSRAGSQQLCPGARATDDWSWQDLRDTHVLVTPCSSLQEGRWSGQLHTAQTQRRLCYLFTFQGPISQLGFLE